MASIPKSINVFALLALVGAQSGFPTSASDSNCLAPAERGTADRATTTLRIVRRSWISHGIVSRVMEIVLRELLGYSVVIVDGSDGSDANWGPEMADGLYDIEIESWYGQETSANYKLYVVQEQKVLNPGSIGYSGRSGLWTFDSMLKKNIFVDYFKLYQDPAAIDLGYLTFADSDLAGFLGEDFPVCKGYDWCASGHLEGYWAPPQCESNPSECLEIFMAVPGYDTGYFEQLTRNLGLKAIHGYYGWGMPTKIRKLKVEGKNPIFYWWEPDPFLQSVNAVRINFPGHFLGCDVGNNQNPNTGTTTCDYGESRLQKLISKRLADDAPEAFYVLSKFQVIATDLTLMMKAHMDAGGANSTEEVACDYVRTLLLAVSDRDSLIPPCLSHPISSPKTGDLVFHKAKMECVNTTVYPTAHSTLTCPSIQKGTNDNSAVTIKVVNRFWVSHSVLSAIVELILKERLGYSVEMVDASSGSDTNWGPEMAEDLFDVDIESWFAGRLSDSYREYVLEKKIVSNPGSIGFAGRSGLWILGSAAQAHPFADYYKFFLNASQASSAGFLTFGESALPSFLGEGFPVCRGYDWCGSGRFTGYWAPPQCIVDPDACIEVFMAVPTYDTGYFEQLTRNLGVKFVHGYYGWGMPDKVIEIQKDPKTPVFYWWEPDPFLQKVSAQRVSFPNHFFGCDVGNNYDPDSGSTSCDYGETDLQKLMKADLLERAPEAVYFLKNFQILKPEIETMMASTVAGGGNSSVGEAACKFITENQDRILEFAPDCISKPLTKIWSGGLVFRRNSLTCEKVDCPKNTTIKVANGDVFCDVCTSGTVPNSVQLDCEFCPVGKAMNHDRIHCETCTPGSFSNARGLTACGVCPEGRFSKEHGSAKCEECAVGKFQNSKQSSMCFSCGPKKTTLKLADVSGEQQYILFSGASSEDDCGCRIGTRPQSGECVECVEGMDCKGRSDIWMKVGFSSEAELSVFKCHNALLKCPGGLPGDSCAKGRIGISCAECKKNMAPQDDGTCIPCKGLDTLFFVVAIFVFAIALIVIYWAIATKDHTKTSHALVFCALNLSIFVTLVQQLGVISFASLQWPEPLSSFLAIVRVLNFDIEILRLSCVANANPLQRFIVKLCILLIGIVLVSITHIGFVSFRRAGNFMANMHGLIGSVGTLLMVFYISVVSTVIAPLQCAHNPNQKWTVRRYQSVQCWTSDGEHTRMVVLGILALSIPLGYLVHCALAVSNFPKHMRSGNVVFLRSYAFLLSRYRTQVYWYSMVNMHRSLFMSIVPVLPYAVVQIFFLQILSIAHLFLIISLQPWRVWLANIVEGLFACGILLVLTVGAIAIEETSLQPVAWLGIILILTMFFFMPLCLCWGLYSYYRNKHMKPFQFFICHHKAGGGCFARLMKLVLTKHPNVNKKVFIDCDDLRSLDLLFDYVGFQTDTNVIVCSKDILSRQWCMGEIVTAKRHNTFTTRLLWTEFVEPTPEFIESYGDHVDISGLAEHGISLAEVQDALRWVPTLQKVEIPRSLSETTVCDLANILVHARNTVDTAELTYVAHKIIPNGEITILVDCSSVENESSALVLRMYLLEFTAGTPDRIPFIFPDVLAAPQSITSVLIMCTDGALQQPNFLKGLIAVAQHQTKYVPILANEGFRFPCHQFLEDSRAVVDTVTDMPQELLSLILSVFKSIAVVFQPEAYSSTEEILKAQALQIYRRLTQAEEIFKAQDFWNPSRSLTSLYFPPNSRKVETSIDVDVSKGDKGRTLDDYEFDCVI